MCVLILLRNLHPDYPVIVASNREEDPQRSTMPPGLKVLGERRALCPQDRRHGGTWIGVNDRGMLVAITNAPGDADPAGFSRGLVALAALSQPGPADALAGVAELVARERARPFQMIAVHADECGYAAFGEGGFTSGAFAEDRLVMTNLLPPERCELPGLLAWEAELRAQPEDIEAVLDHLVVALATGRGRDRRTGEEFPVCVREGARRTVSATLLAVPRPDRGDGLATLCFRYAAGNPLEVPFRDYDGLSRRLVN